MGSFKNVVENVENTTSDDITVAEFLEFEFMYELATYIGIQMSDLKQYSCSHSKTSSFDARYVLNFLCTDQCKKHMYDMYDNMRKRRRC